jgi:hypothetical protein
MNHRHAPQELDQSLVLDFLWNFSVFECALKREGFLVQDRYGGAKPDWDKFGAKLAGSFERVSLAGFTEAVEEIRRLSPKRQVVNGGRLGWESINQRIGDSEEEYVLRLLRTVRNNLFHGGKYPDGPVEEVARDRALLQASLVILQGLFVMQPYLNRWVEEASGPP